MLILYIMVKSLISSVIICAFLLNDLSYANPDTLSKPVGDPGIFAAMQREMRRKLDAKLNLPPESESVNRAEFISTEQLAELRELMKNVELAEKELVGWLRKDHDITALDKIPVELHERVIWIIAEYKKEKELLKKLGLSSDEFMPKEIASPFDESSGRSPEHSRRILGKWDSPHLSKTPTWGTVPIFRSNDVGSINRDIGNALKMLDGLNLEAEKRDGVKYYTVRYDVSRIQRGSPAEEALKACVNELMRFKLRGEDRIKLIASGETNKGLIRVDCYKDRVRSDGQKVGEGCVDVVRVDDGDAFRIPGMVNMALAASENNIDFVKRQFADMTGEAPSYEELSDMGNGIWRITLPRAERVPNADEYYELTIKKLREAA
ncbi:MAG: hypothetical protein Q7S07_04830 [Candidatus Omnitrophota bacterium]|nr:hypothetical protein [Candidatus Omnitrophota bacterium]